MSKELGIVLSNRIVVPKVNIGAMKLNDCFIGGSHCPSEVISMRKDDGTLFRVKLHYDMGASHCLANELIKPIVVEETKSTFPIQLSTINSTTCAVRTLATVKVNDTKFSCILVKSMHMDSRTMPIPSVWEQYRGNWIEQDTDDDRMLPQILVGSDKATLFPRPVIGANHNVVETSTARLLKSVVSGKYLAHGFDPPAHQIQLCEDDPARVTHAASVQFSHSAGGVTKPCSVTDSVTPPTGSSRLIDETEKITTILTTDSDTNSESEDNCSTRFGTETVQVHCSAFPQLLCNASVLMSNNL